VNEHQNHPYTFVIAEAGVNHNGSVAMACELVTAAKVAGADAVKFQDFRADSLVARSAPKAQYQKTAVPGDDNQYAMLQGLELSPDDFKLIHDHCLATGIEFLASPFDEQAADRLVDLGMRVIKIPSGEITNLPLLRHLGSLKRSIILSTGMSWLGEVETAVRTLQESGATDITLLHCVTEYPAPPEQINLRAMRTLCEAFGLPVGYSDHTPGTEIAVAATALGATVIEKHLTLDTSLPGPDHSASLDPIAFKSMVTAIRNVERALGSGRKEPAPCEVPNMVVARKSVVSARTINAGQRIEPNDVVVKRPGSGIAPSDLELVIGRLASRDIEVDQVINWSDLT
jgi:N-acetylneuraminate synthase/N,N'-diacetyllegionaminate synthase